MNARPARGLNLNLKRKFILTILLVSLAVSVLQNVILYRIDMDHSFTSLRNKISVLVKLLGDNSTSALQFRSREDALELLQSLHNEPLVRDAYLFTREGQVLAEYIATGDTMAIPLVDVQKERFEQTADRIIALHPVFLDKDLVGALYVSVDLRELTEVRNYRLRIGACVLVGVLAVAIVLSLWCQRFFVGPITDLACLSDKIAMEKDFSLRATSSTEDEIGMLVRSFNAMLDEIQARDRKLQQQTLELARSNEQLEQFANIAAHDLQEPLRKTRAFADRLTQKCQDELGEKGREYLTRMNNSVERMQTLISDLLEFSRIKSRAKPFAKTNLTHVAETVVSDLEVRIAELSGRVELHELPTIDADSMQIQQLLQNLVANGLKFHQKGESPVVTISSRLPEPATPWEQKVCEIIVRDNGIGFDEKYLDRIFDPFQRLYGRDEYEGTGMGLAICRRIVERHRGTITASSAPGNGAAFIVTLPIVQEPVEAATA